LRVELPDASIEIDRAGRGRSDGCGDGRWGLLLLGVLSSLASRHQPPTFIVLFQAEPGRRALGGHLFRRGVGHALRGLWPGARTGRAGGDENAGEEHPEKRPRAGHDLENSKISATRPARDDGTSELGARSSFAVRMRRAENARLRT